MKEQAMQAIGSNGTLHFEGDQIRIERKKGLGNFLLQGLQGDKTIALTHITAVQFRPAGSIVVGYIQFTIPGVHQKSGGVMEMTKDENAVLFTKDQQPDFERIKTHIEHRMAALRQTQPQQATAAPTSAVEELSKLASLVERGFLSRDEFDVAKKKLLGI
jgi:hypothetical protein